MARDKFQTFEIRVSEEKILKFVETGEIKIPRLKPSEIVRRDLKSNRTISEAVEQTDRQERSAQQNQRRDPKNDRSLRKDRLREAHPRDLWVVLLNAVDRSVSKRQSLMLYLSSKTLDVCFQLRPNFVLADKFSVVIRVPDQKERGPLFVKVCSKLVSVPLISAH